MELDLWSHLLAFNNASLSLENFWIEPTDIAHLPLTLNDLSLVISSSIEPTPEAPERPVFDPSKLPPHLTSLKVGWTSKIAFLMSFPKSKLEHCHLDFLEGHLFCFETHLSTLPESLTSFHSTGIDLKAPVKGIGLANHPRLTSITADYAHIDYLEFLPRVLQVFEVTYIDGIDNSPLVANGQMLKHLPPSLKVFLLKGSCLDATSEFELPAQRFDHLPALTDLSLYCAPKISSSILRNLPRSLKHLDLEITEWDNDDLPYLPPRIKTLFVPVITPKLAEHMSLSSLAYLENVENVSDQVMKIARRRVREASRVPWSPIHDEKDD